MRGCAVRRCVGAIVLGCVWSVTSAPAAPVQEGGRSAEEINADINSELDELRRQVDVLAAEMERLRSGEVEIEFTDEQARQFGLGPAAASVYQQDQGVSIAGYGEMLYQNFADERDEI